MISFSLGCTLYCCRYKYKRLKYRYRHFKIRIRDVNFTRYGACTKQLAGKRVSFCSSLKAVSTDTSFIKIGVCCQKWLTLEFNFHYRLSSHCVYKKVSISQLILKMHQLLVKSNFSLNLTTSFWSCELRNPSWTIPRSLPCDFDLTGTYH